MIWGICLFLLLFLGKNDVLAGCETSISNDGKFLTSSTVSFQLTIKNTGDSDINWIKIPINFGSVLSSLGINGPGWNPESREDSIVFTNWYLPAGQAVSFDVEGVTGDVPESFTWVPKASLTDESNAFDCSGSDVSILSSFSALTAPQPVVISGIMVTVESSEATVRWQTDVNSTGIVEYGNDTGYGKNIVDSTISKDHSLKLSGLNPSSQYHYRIVSSNNNGTTTTEDYSLTTSIPGITQAPIVVTVTNTVSTIITNTTVITPVPTVKPSIDTVSPTVKISTAIDNKVFKESPTIEGVASDGGVVNAGVANIEYSVDGGKDWSPVDYIAKPGTKSTSFQFTPPILDDGNYQIKVRASDITKNQGTSKTVTIVIDRLPPQAGSGLFLVGPLLLSANANGQIYSVAGAKMRTAWSAAGGPLKFDLKYGNKTKTLIKNDESGLWGGELEMMEPGTYSLSTDLIDGAGTKRQYNLGDLNILSKGVVTGPQGNLQSRAKVSVFVFEKSENKFVLWNSAPYGQVNPQVTEEDGGYFVFLPEGRYFIEIVSKGLRQLRTTIFDVVSPTPIVKDFKLEQTNWWKDWWAKEVIFVPSSGSGVGTLKSDLIGKIIPDFDLGADQLKSSQILGKKTVIALLTTWMPDFANQLAQLDDLQKNNQMIKVLAVFEQESVAKIENISKMENLSFRMVADPDGILTEILGSHNVPTTVILDRKGIIKEITIGYLESRVLKEKIIF